MNPNDKLLNSAKLNAIDTCGNCKFAIPHPGDPASLICRRYPPLGIIVPTKAVDLRNSRETMVPQLQFLSPNVGHDWSCGEFDIKSAVVQ